MYLARDQRPYRKVVGSGTNDAKADTLFNLCLHSRHRGQQQSHCRIAD